MPILISAMAMSIWLHAMASGILEGFPHRKVRWPLGVLVFPSGRIRNRKIPIPGYGIKIPRGLGGICSRILEEEGISLEDFRIPQFQEFDLRGDYRDLIVTPGDFRMEGPQQDDLNPGRFKVTAGFSLPSGSYATMVIKAIFS